MKHKFIIGCDISKKTIDAFLSNGKDLGLHFKFGNSVKAVKAWLTKSLSEQNIKINQCLVCMEHTGVYNNHLLAVLTSMKVATAVIHPLEIKRSMGFSREKTDKIDAAIIAGYGCRFYDKLKLWKPKRKVIVRLKYLTSLRERLLKVKTTIEVANKEITSFESAGLSNCIDTHTKGSIQAILNDIKSIEVEIDKIIKEDVKLFTLRKQLTSVPGIGIVTASEIIIRTNEFENFTCSKKLACHVGVVPFKQQSGTSLNKRPRVSHQAQKRLKTLLTLGALSAIRNNEKIRNYYDRKVAEGKNKMSVINAIRNKLIRTAFAVVKNNTTYQTNYNINLQ